jgi:hypothetical protein
MFSPYPWAPRWSSGNRSNWRSRPGDRWSRWVVRCPARIMIHDETRWVCCGVRQGAAGDLMVRRETGPRTRTWMPRKPGSRRGGRCRRPASARVARWSVTPWSMVLTACSAGHTLPCWESLGTTPSDFGALCTDTYTGPDVEASQTCGAVYLGCSFVLYC